MGCLSPDEARRILDRHAAAVGTFVETGTHVGNTLLPMIASSLFVRLHSVELSDALYARARAIVPAAVTLHHGDSAAVLRQLAQQVREPALFWLDAHWCETPDAATAAPCPLFGELDAIAARAFADVVVIDDVHCFGKKWSDGPGADWTHIDEDAIVARLGRVTDRYLMDGKLVLHRGEQT